MTIGSIGARSTLRVQGLVDMRRQLDELQRQLGSGKKADTYAGLGLGRGFAVSLRAQLSAFQSYEDAIKNVDVRLNLSQTALGRISDIANAVKGSALQSSSTDGSGVSNFLQSTASNNLEEILALLNTQAGDRYLFSGRSGDQPAVETVDHIMNGNGAQAGLKQVIAERNLADLGTNGLGRMVFSAAPGSVTLAEDAPGSPFGLKLASISSTLSNATTTGPAGVPPAVSVNLTGVPSAGEAVKFQFTLPAGTTENITLTATTAGAPGGPNGFAIAANATATAANLQLALTASLSNLADTSL